MRSLQESLFDKNLATSDFPFEKLLKSSINIHDINELVFDCDSAASFDAVKNKYLKKWVESWIEKYYDIRPIPYFCAYGRIDDWDENEKANEEADFWLHPGEIHTDVEWNDVMYANVFDISWEFWGKECDWKNITEWVIWKSSNSNYALILINRKDYSEPDQMVIHKLIEIVHKKYRIIKN